MYSLMCVGAQGGQRRGMGPLELGLQVAVSHLMRGLGTEVKSSAPVEPSLQHPADVSVCYCDTRH